MYISVKVQGLPGIEYSMPFALFSTEFWGISDLKKIRTDSEIGLKGCKRGVKRSMGRGDFQSESFSHLICFQDLWR